MAGKSSACAETRGRLSRWRGMAVLGLVALIGLGIGLSFGSVSIPLDRLWRALTGSETATVTDIVWKLRMPRVLAAFACGGLLSLSGVLLQVLLRNPLADPYIFGVSGGAALGVLLSMLLGWGTAMQTGTGLAGALAVSALVFGLGFGSSGRSAYRLLLTGVVVAAGLNALLSLILVLAPQTAVKGMLFWLMGDLGQATSPWLAILLLGVVFLIALPLTGAMNVLALGRTKAQSLGVSVLELELALYGLAAICVLTSVLMAGTVGFVGLIVPHAVRLLGLSDHRWLLPGAVLAGGSFLVLADTLARAAWAPLQLPVGVLTALAGVPVLLLLLVGRDRDAAH